VNSHTEHSIFSNKFDLSHWTLLLFRQEFLVEIYMYILLVIFFLSIVYFSKFPTYNTTDCVTILFFKIKTEWFIFLKNWLDHWFPKSATRTTGGPQIHTYTNQYLVLRGPPNYPKWSAHQKSFWTTGLDEQYKQ